VHCCAENVWVPLTCAEKESDMVAEDDECKDADNAEGKVETMARETFADRLLRGANWRSEEESGGKWEEDGDRENGDRPEG
jgi:hypothetical protein